MEPGFREAILIQAARLEALLKKKGVSLFFEAFLVVFRIKVPISSQSGHIFRNAPLSMVDPHDVHFHSGIIVLS